MRSLLLFAAISLFTASAYSDSSGEEFFARNPKARGAEEFAAARTARDNAIKARLALEEQKDQAAKTGKTLSNMNEIDGAIEMHRGREVTYGQAMNAAQEAGEAALQKSLGAPDSACAKDAEKTESTCTMGLDPGQLALVNMMSQRAGNMLASGGTENSCKAAKTLSLVLQGANVAHGIACKNAITSCKKKCNSFLNGTGAVAMTEDDLSEAWIYTLQDPARSHREQRRRATEESRDSCKALEVKVVAAFAQAAVNATSLLQSQQCQKEAKATVPNMPGSPGGPGGDIPTAQIPVPGLTPPNQIDCANPVMASSASCVCAANPRDPICSAGNAGIETGTFATSDPSGATGDFMGEPTGPEFEREIERQQAANQSLGAGSGGGSSGGGGMNAGNGASALPPEDTGGGPGEGPYKTDIMGGTVGGGGSVGGGYAAGGGGYESGNGRGGRSMLDGLADKLNLKNFLPGKGDFKNRGLAGMAGAGGDGITGPNGPTLFEKVSNRYQKKQGELLP